MKNKISRRAFIQTTGLAGAGIMLSENSFASVIRTHKIKAIAFDAFPIFDPRPIFRKVNQMFPEKGEQLTSIWRTKQFDYQWLRLLGNNYKNFWDVTKDALDYAGAECGIGLTELDKNIIMSEYKTIDVWPDVIHALALLKNESLRLCFLSNMTRQMLNWGLQNSNSGEYFDYIISTDDRKTYKPSPTAYQMGVDILNLKKEEILFVAFAGWDAAGAKWYGYPTFWMNRLNLPMEKLESSADGMGKDITHLVEFVTRYNNG